MKKIIMLLDNDYSSDFRVEKEVMTLSNAGYEILILALKSKELPNEEILEFCTIKRVLNPLFKSPYRKGYKNYIQNTATKISRMDFDVLHCHDYHMLTIGANIKKIRKDIFLVYDSHEYLSGWPFYRSAKGIFNRVKGYLVWKKNIREERKYVQYVDRVITVSKSLSEELFKDFNLPLKPIILQNVPDPFEVSNEKYFHKYFNLSSKTKILLQLGNIYHTDIQLMSLFTIVSEIKDLALIFIGNKPRYYEVKRMVQSSSFKNNVFFHHYLEKKRLYPIISTADIGLVHIRAQWKAHRVGFANRFMEYSMAGLAIISTKQEACIELGEKYGHTVFYDENNQTQLKNALLNCTSQLESYKKNTEAIREELNWKKESQKLLSLYTTINETK